MRDYELKKTNDCFDATHLDLVRAREEQTRLSEEQMQAQRQLDIKHMEKLDLHKRLEAEQNRNRCLTQTLFELDGKCRISEDNLN